MNLQVSDLKNIIYMKYGVHASEPTKKIINRKEKEILDNGFTFWRYGGSLCHPINQVQPFARECIQNGEKVYLVMESTSSELWNAPSRSEEYSVDKNIWYKIPQSINVYGSKLAICIKSIERCDFELNMNEYEIAVGPSAGKSLGAYIKGRVDKGCAKRIESIENVKENNEQHLARISLIAELTDPFAVFCKMD